jgi:hypothetical protein
MKSVWITPRLIELVRSTTEEAVLVACKGSVNGIGEHAPSNTYDGCTQPNPTGVRRVNGCANCETISSS